MGPKIRFDAIRLFSLKRIFAVHVVLIVVFECIVMR
jgi:hypothetical protein